MGVGVAAEAATINGGRMSESDNKRIAMLERIAADLLASLTALVEWAEEYREQCKRAGERPVIDAGRVQRGRAAIKRARAEI